MSNSGLSAAIQMAAQLSLDFPEMEVLSLGRSATNDADAELELGSRWILYDVLLCGEIRLAVALMDGIESPQTILRSPDSPAGWDVMKRLVGAFEKAETKSLERPIEVGTPGDPDCFVIGCRSS